MNRKYNKILVLGAGPVKIGQSVEFDFSALQVCRALKEEGISVVFADSTPSALATDKTFADKIYIEPLNIESVKRILEKERPDALLSTAGGDDSLELSLELAQNGYLDETGTSLLGVDGNVIRSLKNRRSFTEAMAEIGEPTVDAVVVNSTEEACEFADKAGYPVIVRPAYTPDRENADFCFTKEKLSEKAERSLEASIVSQILIEKCIAGWKEIEFEVIRDSADNCIAVSSVESVDPVGIHTGDSIVAVPAQTLSEDELSRLRAAALRIASGMGVEGSCNVQFALSPDGKEYFVTGVDPRLSRTSALVSKATGYDIAYVSAKIALGRLISEIGAFAFEEDGRCAVKFPKWSFDSFDNADRKLGTVMQATGECIAVADSFEAAFMKAVRGAADSRLVRLPYLESVSDDELNAVIEAADDRRIFAVYEALYRGFSVDSLNSFTAIDKYFLNAIKNIADTEKLLKDGLNRDLYIKAKKLGFTDFAIEQLSGVQCGFSAAPSYKEILGLTNEKVCFYSVYDFDAPETEYTAREKYGKRALVIGGGPAAAGRSGDNDYCVVHAVNTLKKAGFEVILLNNNPASAATDYTVADRLYIDPLCEEDIMNVVHKENPDCALLLFGGSEALEKSEALKNAGVEILGPDYDFYKKLTNKIEFFDILDDAGVKHTSSNKLFVGTCIETYIISDGEDYFVPAVCEHIEKAHINSGDSISVCPTVSVGGTVMNTLSEYIKNIVAEIPFKGALDIQFVIFDNDLFVTKASVTNTALVPFMTKASGTDIASVAVRCMAGEKLADMGIASGIKKGDGLFFVRVPVFSFEKLRDADMLLGEKTKSTGDVMGIGDTFDNALLKGMIASGMRVKRTGNILVSVRESDKSDAYKMSAEFLSQGFKIYAVSDTAAILNANHIAANSASAETAVEMINGNKFSYVVSTLESGKRNDANMTIRRAALMKKVPVFTSLQSARAFGKALANNNVMEELEVTDI